MSDDNEHEISALRLAAWMREQGTPFSFEECAAFKAALEAGTEPPLTDRERRILAVAGLLVLNLCDETAGRLFGATMYRGIAGMMAGGKGVVLSGERARAFAIMMGLTQPDEDEDEPEGGGKPS